MKVLFLTNGGIEWASARYRAFWMAECREDWEAMPIAKANPTPDADAYIFVKVFNHRAAQELRDKGKRVYLDLCDPAHWFSPVETDEMLKAVDGVVCSNYGLREDLARWWGIDDMIHTIPDRLKLEHYDRQRKHREVDPVRFIWFGSAQNRPAMYVLLITLERLYANGFNLELTVMDDSPDIRLSVATHFPIYHQRWRLDTEIEVLSNHDIAMLPEYPGAWGKVKSNNKELTAWACGLPVLSDWHYDDNLLELLDSPTKRSLEGRTGRGLVEEHYQREQSVQDWEALLCTS